MDRRDFSPIALIQELFAFMTALCEDATDIAMQGHADDDPEQLTALANSLRETGHRLIVLSEAVTTIVELYSAEPPPLTQPDESAG